MATISAGGRHCVIKRSAVSQQQNKWQDEELGLTPRPLVIIRDRQDVKLSENAQKKKPSNGVRLIIVSDWWDLPHGPQVLGLLLLPRSVSLFLFNRPSLGLLFHDSHRSFLSSSFYFLFNCVHPPFFYKNVEIIRITRPGAYRRRPSGFTGIAPRWFKSFFVF